MQSSRMSYFFCDTFALTIACFSALTDEPEGIPEPKGTSSDGDVYFEVLHLQPIQLDLSFMRTDRVNVDQKSVSRSSSFSSFADVFWTD